MEWWRIEYFRFEVADCRLWGLELLTWFNLKSEIQNLQSLRLQYSKAVGHVCRQSHCNLTPAARDLRRSQWRSRYAGKDQVFFARTKRDGTLTAQSLKFVQWKSQFAFCFHAKTLRHAIRLSAKIAKDFIFFVEPGDHVMPLRTLYWPPKYDFFLVEYHCFSYIR